MGGVILRMFDEQPRQGLADELKLPLDQIYWAIFDSPVAKQAGLGQVTTIEHWQWVIDYLGLPQAQLPEFFQRFCSADQIDQELIAYIRKLRHQYRVALLSNASDNIRQLLTQTWGVANAFDEIIISAEVGMLKPDAQIYHLAVDRLGIKPQEAIFIDDIFENVQAARNAGLQAIHFINPESARHTLEQILSLDDPVTSQDSPDPRILDAPTLMDYQIELEYSRDNQGLLLPKPNSSEQAVYVVYQFPGVFKQYFSAHLPEAVRQTLQVLGPLNAFNNSQGILKIIGDHCSRQVVGPYLSYFFAHSPLPIEFPHVVKTQQRFEIQQDKKPASWAWSVRENDICAEVAVETLYAYQKQGLARQVTAAWAHHIISQDKIPFFSHLVSNNASRQLARSLGLVQFASCVTFT